MKSDVELVASAVGGQWRAIAGEHIRISIVTSANRNQKYLWNGTKYLCLVHGINNGKCVCELIKVRVAKRDLSLFYCISLNASFLNPSSILPYNYSHGEHPAPALPSAANM